MRVFGGWWALQNPGTIKTAALAEAGFWSEFPLMTEAMKHLHRKDRLKVGLMSLNKAKGFH
jgi:hypothetical protein